MNDWLQITRPVNCLLAGLASLVGSWIVMTNLGSLNMWIGALVVALITAGGNVFNDLTDIVGDRINHPNRQLVRGVISRSAATGLLTGLWGVAALLTALLLGEQAAGIVMSALILLTFYSLTLKGWPLAGNIAVSILAGAVLYFGASVASAPSARHVPEIIIFGVCSSVLLHLSRELTKSVEDVAGDRAQQRRTLPILIGKRGTMLLALIPLIILIAVTFTLLGASDSLSYFVWLLTFLFVVLLFFGVRGVQEPCPARLRRFSAALKIVMGVGIALLPLMSSIMSGLRF